MTTKRQNHAKPILRTLLTLLLGAALLTGCMSAEERQEKERQQAEWEEKAKDIAEEYVNKKYDIDAKAVDVHLQKSYDVFSFQYISNAVVDLEFNGKPFQAYVDAEDKTGEKNADNYEYETVIAAAKETCEELFGDIEGVWATQERIWEGVDKDRCVFLQDRYNGEINPAMFYVDCIDKDLSGALSIAEENGLEYIIIRSFRSREDMVDYRELEEDGGLYQFYNGWSPLHMRELVYRKGRAKPYYTFFELGQYDDFIFGTVGIRADDVVIRDTDRGELTDYNSRFIDEGKAAFASTAYMVRRGTQETTQNNLRQGYVFIYYPENKVEKKRNTVIDIGINGRTIESFDENHSGYYIYRMDLTRSSEETFVLIEQERNPE